MARRTISLSSTTRTRRMRAWRCLPAALLLGEGEQPQLRARREEKPPKNTTCVTVGCTGFTGRLGFPFDPFALYVGYCVAWTLNASLTKLSSYRKCSKRRILGHSAQATSLLPIEGTTKCSRRALGSAYGSILASAADLNPRESR